MVRGVVATPAGQALGRHARLLFQQLDALRRDVALSEPPGLADTIVLANSSALARPLSRVIGDVLSRHAGVRILARESSSEVTVHALHAGTADVGLLSDAVDTTGLHAEPLGPDPLVLVAPPGHALAAREAVHFEEALSYDWVGSGESTALHTHLAVRAYLAGAALKVKVCIPSPEGVLDLVARGHGISILPRALLHRLDPGREIAIVRVAEAWAQRRLLVCRRQDARSPVAAALLGEFKAQWETLDARFAGGRPGI
jgi:DNA-binding transcriptional LysR family regulator